MKIKNIIHYFLNYIAIFFLYLLIIYIIFFILALFFEEWKLFFNWIFFHIFMIALAFLSLLVITSENS